MNKRIPVIPDLRDGRPADSYKNPVRQNSLAAAYKSQDEVSFGTVFETCQKFMHELGTYRTHWGVRSTRHDDIVERFPRESTYGACGSVTWCDDRMIVGDGRYVRSVVGMRRGRLGIHQEGDEHIMGDLEVDFDSLLHGRLTVEQATRLADTLLVKGESVFEALTRFMARVQFEDEATIGSEHLIVDDKKIGEFVKDTAVKGLVTIDGKAIVRKT